MLDNKLDINLVNYQFSKIAGRKLDNKIESKLGSSKLDKKLDKQVLEATLPP